MQRREHAVSHPIDALSLLSHEQWEELGRRLRMPPGEVRDNYHEALKRHLDNPVPATLHKVDTPLKDPFALEGVEGVEGAEGGETQSFDLTIIPEVLQVRLDLGLTGGEDWKVSISLTALIFGHDVGGAHLQLSATNSYIEIHPGMLVAKADLKIGVYGEQLCFGIDGQACYWAFGWHCTPINAHNLFCLR